ncbi:MAG: glycosyltransferase family 39 protein [Acidobacteria bacterium]|nr:glycosyltransferase family 39 protein [Acidobacteriota bacterium]
MTPAASLELRTLLEAVRRWWSKSSRSFLWMFSAALAFRLGLIILGHTYKFKAYDNDFSFGWEMGRIGRALANGRAFSDPFDRPTGPTAWEPPLYPYLIGIVFRLFGVYSRTSALVLLTLNSIFSALTAIPIALIAKRCFSEKVALWTAWSWVLLPWVMYWSTRWVWETSLTALLLALIFWLTLTLEQLEHHNFSIVYGLLWGVAILTNTSLIAFVPASALWVCHQRRQLHRPILPGALLACFFFIAVITPWVLRNYAIFGKFIFIRSNLGAELRLGNGPGADGTWMWWLHPSQNPIEMRRYEQMGEIAYVARRQHEAIEFIRADYARFAWLSLKRFLYYWTGLPRSSAIPALAPFKNSLFLASSVLAFWGLGQALRRRERGARLFLWLLLTYPTIYYFVFPHPRYRHPIEPELGILIVYVISQAQLHTHR